MSDTYMKVLITSFLLLGSLVRANASEIKYPVSSIPEALLKNAHAIVRRSETVFTVKSESVSIKKKFYAMTILDEKGKRYATLSVHYDKLSKVNNIQGAIYDADGKLLDKLSKSDIEDRSDVSDLASFGDDRYKIARIYKTQYKYPYTVEFEVETTSNNLLFYPTWTPQSDLDVAVERANFQVVMPKELKLRYKEINLQKAVSITNEDSRQIFNWEVVNVAAKEEEEDGPPERLLIPVVYTAPTTFEVEGYKGNMTDWKSFGKWEYDLNAGRDQIPEELRTKLTQLVVGETDEVKKIKKVYEYLQSRTRYVSIQLGIGGWQTFDAFSVYKNGYGDCKALSNYTMAMLKAIGIKSYYTLVQSGPEPDIEMDFVSNQFNHAILCVPLKKDTIWLECTSQTNPFGYMGDFTGNRHALMITSEGGKLVKTPVYKAEDNLQNRTAEVTVDIQGDALVEAKTVYTALQQDYLSMMINSITSEEQKKRIYEYISIPNFDINKFSFTEKKDRIPSITEKLSLTVRKCASKSGKRMFLTPNLMTAYRSIPPKYENRQTDIYIDVPFIDTDTILYHLPTGYQVEFQPEKIAFKSEFGAYFASVTVEQGLVTYIRRRQIHAGKFPKTSYASYLEFCKNTAKADNIQVVLVEAPTAKGLVEK